MVSSIFVWMLQGTFFVFSPSADEKRFGAHGFGQTEERFDRATGYPTHFSRWKKVLGRFVYQGVFSVLASFGCCFFFTTEFWEDTEFIGVFLFWMLI
jgi:hypothetical protein